MLHTYVLLMHVYYYNLSNTKNKLLEIMALFVLLNVY